MADARQDLQLPESRPRRDRSLDDPRDEHDQAEVALTEQRLARLIRERRGSDEELLVLLADVPQVQRLTARIVMIRELGAVRATRMFTRAFGSASSLAPLAPQFPISQKEPLFPGSRARYDFARARGIKDLLVAIERYAEVLENNAVEGILLGVGRNVALAAISLLRQIPSDLHNGGFCGRLDHLTAGGFSQAVFAIRSGTVPQPYTVGSRQASALLTAAERRGGTLYRREAASTAELDLDAPAVEEALLRRGGGASLPTDIRQDMENRFGADFRNVRIHTDEVAHAATAAVSAEAFTVGEDIFFSRGSFAQDAAGRRLIAHELTHVVQNWHGRTAPSSNGVFAVSRGDDVLEYEAREAERALDHDRERERVAMPTAEPNSAKAPAFVGVVPGVAGAPPMASILRKPSKVKAKRSQQGGNALSIETNPKTGQFKVRMGPHVLATGESPSRGSAKVTVNAIVDTKSKSVLITIDPGGAKRVSMGNGIGGMESEVRAKGFRSTVDIRPGQRSEQGQHHGSPELSDGRTITVGNIGHTGDGVPQSIDEGNGRHRITLSKQIAGPGQQRNRGARNNKPKPQHHRGHARKHSPETPQQSDVDPTAANGASRSDGSLSSQEEANPAAGPDASQEGHSGSGTNVGAMDTSEKLLEALRRSLKYVGPDVREKLAALLTPEAVAVLAATLGAAAVVQFIPILGEAMDAIIALYAAYTLGSEALAVIDDFVEFVEGAIDAQTEQDLDTAGHHFSRVITTVGIDVAVAILFHKGAKALKGLKGTNGEVPGESSGVVESETVETTTEVEDRAHEPNRSSTGNDVSNRNGTESTRPGVEDATAKPPPKRIYSARELVRRAAEPGPFHDFPESFDGQIFERGNKSITRNFFKKARSGLSNDSITYTLRGSVNKHMGTFEISVRPSVSGNVEVIMHRFFRPDL